MDRRKFLRCTVVSSSLLALPLVSGRHAFAAALPANITDFSALELSAAIRIREVSCAEVMSAYLSHIEHLNPVYNAIVGLVDEDFLLQQAADSDEALARGNYAGWMHGMPHAVKDLTAVRGLIHTSGSPMFADRIAEQDAGWVTRVRDHGAIFIGKTNSPEFGLGSQTYNPVFGATASAWRPDLTAGGSSGGAASGLGTYMLPVADGSDMMGSLRNPGAFNNVIGYRPSAGSMNDTPPTELPLATSGPMGRNTADAIQLLNTMLPNPITGDFTALPLSQIRIAWMANLDGYLTMESGILPLCESALNTVSDAGAEVEAVQSPFDFDQLWECWTTLRHSGRGNMLNYYNNPESKALLKPELIWEIEQGLSLTEEDIMRAKAIRERWYAELERLFNEYDFLVLPTAQVFPFSKDVHWPKYIGLEQMDTYHRWMEVVIPGSLGALPIINVPVGFDAGGRPMGMQIMGKRGDDKRVLEFGLAYEQITSFLARRPALN